MAWSSHHTGSSTLTCYKDTSKLQPFILPDEGIQNYLWKTLKYTLKMQAKNTLGCVFMCVKTGRRGKKKGCDVYVQPIFKKL